jgi:hypothetical protein
VEPRGPGERIEDFIRRWQSRCEGNRALGGRPLAAHQHVAPRIVRDDRVQP